jgi:peptidyl-prolyl cis-trans isomerase D
MVLVWAFDGIDPQPKTTTCVVSVTPGGAGNEPKLVGAAFNKAFLHKPSAPIAGNAGVFVISVRSQGAKAATQDLASFESDLLNRTRSVIYRTNIGLKKVAKIKDNRMKVY